MNRTYVFNNGGYSLTWGEIADWYLSMPLFGQILVAVGLFTILALIIVAVYYLLKGIAYLIYYIFKGVYYLIHGIFLGIYKIFEGLYYLITGKPKKTKEVKEDPDINEKTQEPSEIPHIPIEEFHPIVEYFCSECGMKFSDRMAGQITSNGIAFCEHCGKGFKIVDNSILELHNNLTI